MPPSPDEISGALEPWFSPIIEHLTVHKDLLFTIPGVSQDEMTVNNNAARPVEDVAPSSRIEAGGVS